MCGEKFEKFLPELNKIKKKEKRRKRNFCPNCEYNFERINKTFYTSFLNERGEVPRSNLRTIRNQIFNDRLHFDDECLRKHNPLTSNHWLALQSANNYPVFPLEPPFYLLFPPICLPFIPPLLLSFSPRFNNLFLLLFLSFIHSL